MITAEQYFGAKISHPECTPDMKWNADHLLIKMNALLAEAAGAGAYTWPIDPDTGSCISGSKGGSGDGGFRLSTSKTGSPTSAHKQANGGDVFDPADCLDSWISSFDRDGGARNEVLERHGLYREAPAATPGWCHLQQTATRSGRRTFNP